MENTPTLKHPSSAMRPVMVPIPSPVYQAAIPLQTVPPHMTVPNMFQYPMNLHGGLPFGVPVLSMQVPQNLGSHASMLPMPVHMPSVNSPNLPDDELNAVLINAVSVINAVTLQRSLRQQQYPSSTPLVDQQVAVASIPPKESRGASSSSSKSPRSKRVCSSLSSAQDEPQGDTVDAGTSATHSDGESDKRGGDSVYGESRLTIQFENFGTRGLVPQGFGRGSCIIPDGLIGRHTLYGESWRFCIKHETYDKEAGLACITWSLTNLVSNNTTAITETLAEARKRELHGRTIANQVVKKALETRAQDLESRLNSEPNDTWRLHLKGKIDALRPARFTQGPLAFGLHHKAVQDRMKEILEEERQAASAGSGSNSSSAK